MQALHGDATAADLVPGLAIALVLLSLAVLLALLIAHRLRGRARTDAGAAHGDAPPAQTEDATDDDAGGDADDAGMFEDEGDEDDR